MLVLAGLGNPGADHARHRHNVGFMTADAIANAHNFGPPRAKFQSELREGFFEGPSGRTRAIILKPLTYMNDSGRAVGEAVRFYKVEPSNVIVFYDELDLAPGKLKVKTGGGAAGHNGIRSIDAHIGNDFWRIRIGIGHPGDKSRVTGHVLGNFAKSDQDWLDPLLDAIAAAAPFLCGEKNRFTTDIAQRLAPARQPSPKQPSPKLTKKPSKPITPEASAETAAAPKKPESKSDAAAAPANLFEEALNKLLGRNK